MKERSPASFISLSAFLHGAAFLGLAILPALKLLPLDQIKDAIEMTEVTNAGTETPAPTIEEPVAAVAPAPAPAPVEIKPVAETPRPVMVPPIPRIVRKPVPAKIPKKVVAVDPDESLLKEEVVAKAQEDAEEYSKEVEDKFVPAPETTEAIGSADEDVVQTTVQSATAEAISKQAREELNQIEAPSVNPVAEKLSDISPATAAPKPTTGSNELEGVAGPTADDLRSYLDLKQARGNRAPIYPTNARRSGWQGEVLLNYYVTAEGNVTNVRIVRSSGFAALDSEAVRAISRYRFIKGQEGWASHPVVFSLKTTAQNTSASADALATKEE